MADIFQEAFNAANMEGTALPMRSTGAGYYGRMQQIMQMERDRHAEFLRQYNRDQDHLGDSKGVTVLILSRSLEGKLRVCRCLFKENSNFPVTSKVSTDCDMDDSSIKRTIIFSPKICDNVDLVAGSIIHIYPPWIETIGTQPPRNGGAPPSVANSGVRLGLVCFRDDTVALHKGSYSMSVPKPRPVAGLSPSARSGAEPRRARQAPALHG